MLKYIIKRLLLIIPTLLIIMALNFAVIQFMPGGPVEQMIAQVTGQSTSATARLSGSGSEVMAKAPTPGAGNNSSVYRGAQGLDPEFIKRIEKMYGFDKPAYERFGMMVWNYMTFDFGESYFRKAPVIDIVLEKMPVSLTLGIASTLILYLVCIPLGIAKAVRNGSRFDVATSGTIIFANAIPGFLFAVVLVTVLGGYLDWFPLRGLVSEGHAGMSFWQQAGDRVWHAFLPVLCMVIGGFAQLTMLVKNGFLDEINRQYVVTARAKGLTERRVLYGHVFRNAMLIVIAGFPAALVGMLFTGSLLIEMIFSLDGLGLLGFEAAINRDYPIVFANLYIFTLIGLVMNIVSDVMYRLIDPRIDFERRSV